MRCGDVGLYIDLTGTFDQARHESRQEVLDEALPDLFENRAAIEQAKGVMMAVYRVSPDQAFRVLQWRSQETNIKLRTLAKQLIREVGNLPATSAAVQSQFDHLLLTIHEQIPRKTALDITARPLPSPRRFPPAAGCGDCWPGCARRR